MVKSRSFLALVSLLTAAHATIAAPRGEAQSAMSQLREMAGSPSEAVSTFRPHWRGSTLRCLNDREEEGYNHSNRPLSVEEPALCREYVGERVSVHGGCWGCRFTGLHLARADISWSNFDYADLDGAVIERTNLRYATFRRASMRAARLAQLFLEEIDFTEADLRWANLGAADLKGAKLKGAKLNGAILSWAGLDGTDLQYAHYDQDTVLPFDDEEAARRGMIKDD